MEASPARVIQYFNGEKQNLIPLFQRPYTWNKEKWETLWNDLLIQYEEGDTGRHFMGAIVSLPARSTPVGVNKYLIIDGQQRLTTVSLLLCALRDSLDTNSAARIQEVYLTNRYREPEDTLKFVPTQADRDVYRSIVERKISNNNAESRMVSAYEFFKEKIQNSVDSNDGKILPSRVLTTLEQCLQVVMINLGDDDDPYLIFESLNFKGEPLTQADLVRNYLLMQFRHSVTAGGDQERIHQEFWVPLERLLQTSLAEFLRHYVMKDGEDIKQGGVYVALKTKLKELTSSNSVEIEIKSLKEFGEIYFKFLSPSHEDNKAISKRLSSLKEIKVATSYPLLLRIFEARNKSEMDSIELENCLKYIESFVVRRAICGIPSNILNQLFLYLAKNFPKEKQVDWLANALRSFNGTRRFPSDSEFFLAIENQAQYGRGSTKFILCRLEESFEHKEVVNLSTTTIEHIMPQTLTEEWKNELGERHTHIHNTFVGTLGNLTLTAYNSELSNSLFPQKKLLLMNTHIELNRWIVQQDVWREEQLKERSKILSNIAAEIWPDVHLL